MTEWHVRYGGRGIMIYWHVERKSTCIYSQLKTCSSSEVAAMIEGVLRHCTEMTVTKQYVDSHGQSEVAFAFCHLLGFTLLPRLKAIHAQKLYRADATDIYPQLDRVLTRAIDWEVKAPMLEPLGKQAPPRPIPTHQLHVMPPPIHKYKETPCEGIFRQHALHQPH
jgi:TnpA family transposase